jgi:hypothetical protein
VNLLLANQEMLIFQNLMFFYGKHCNLEDLQVFYLNYFLYFFFLAVWLLGVGVNFFLFNVIKISVGRLRPNFVSVCQPYTEITNTKECLINNSDYYFPGDLFKCNKTNVNHPRIIDARCSFYSGHSALSIYFAVFIIVYF